MSAEDRLPSPSKDELLTVFDAVDKLAAGDPIIQLQCLGKLGAMVVCAYAVNLKRAGAAVGVREILAWFETQIEEDIAQKLRGRESEVNP